MAIHKKYVLLQLSETRETGVHPMLHKNIKEMKMIEILTETKYYI